MSFRTARIPLFGALLALILCAGLASSASAAIWKFDGKALEGDETVVGSATLSIVVFGLNAACESTLQMTIRNVS